jgi:hypothetical protein
MVVDWGITKMEADHVQLHLISVSERSIQSQAWWWRSVILSTQEAKIGGSRFKTSTDQVSETLSQKEPRHGATHASYLGNRGRRMVL